jgi:hypothetical protein
MKKIGIDTRMIEHSGIGVRILNLLQSLYLADVMFNSTDQLHWKTYKAASKLLYADTCDPNTRKPS